MARSQQRLDPVRWRAPRRPTVIRAAVVTALLTLAGAVLLTAPGRAEGCGPAATGRPDPRADPSTPPAASATAPDPPRVPPGLLGVTVPVADPAVLAVIRPGDRVDLHRAGAGGATHAGVADVLVLVVVPTADIGPPALFAAMTPAQAASTADGPVGTVFRVIVRSKAR